MIWYTPVSFHQVNEAQKGVSITWTGRGLQKALDPQLCILAWRTGASEFDITYSKYDIVYIRCFKHTSILDMKMMTSISCPILAGQQGGAVPWCALHGSQLNRSDTGRPLLAKCWVSKSRGGQIFHAWVWKLVWWILFRFWKKHLILWSLASVCRIGLGNLAIPIHCALPYGRCAEFW